MWYIHTMEYYLSIKNDKMPFAATWMDLEIIILSKETEKDKYPMISLICKIFGKMIQMNLSTKQK